VKNAIWAVLFLSLVGFFFSERPVMAQVDARLPGSFPAMPSAAVTSATRNRILEKYSQLPLRFEMNQGQTDSRVRFLSRGRGYTLFLTPTEALFSVSEAAGGSSDPRYLDRMNNRTSTLRMELSGAKPDAVIAGSDELPGRSNYFIGNDPKQWHTGVPAFERVNYKEVYPGIDLVYYGNQRQLEYDFVIAPGADPNAIRLKVTGSRQIRLDNRGNLLIRVGTGDLRLGAPDVYQEVAGQRRQVEGKWLLSKRHELRFGLGAYDHNKVLVVDPTLTLAYSTYLGGSLTDVAMSVAVDANGDAFITGYTASGNTAPQPFFPTTEGAYQTQCNGCTSPLDTNNVFITELDPTGTVLVYSTFLGGDNGEGANGIAIDSSGNAYVVGTTYSGLSGGNHIDFPTTEGAFQTTCAANCTEGDAFITELNAQGNRLVFSTFLGGTGIDKGNAIAVDSQGAVYVAGATSSTDFPTQIPFQAANAGGTNDGFVTKINSSGTALLYSTYLGGTLDDEVHAIAVDSSLDAYVAGVTSSTDFPTASPLQSANGGGGDAFVAKFNSKGTGLTYSTYLGGNALDQANGIALDSTNNVYLVGTTSSTKFPTQSAYQPSCASCASGTSDAFVTKINSSGSALVYSTYLGGTDSDLGNTIAVDSIGNAFVAGQTSSIDFPVANPNYSFTGCSGCTMSAFVTEFDVAGNGLVYSTYLGGDSTQAANGIALNSSDQAIVAGETASATFPVTTGVVQSTYHGGPEDAFITEFPGAANCTTTDTISGFTVNATVTCTGNFVPDNQTMFVGFVWGDGSTDGFPGCTSPCVATTGTVTLPISHTYATGTYNASPSVTDASGNIIITTGFSVTVPFSITTTSLPGGTVGSAYSQTLTASGGTTPYTWSITVGALPAGLSLSTAGTITGTPTTTGTSNFTVQVKDANASTATQPLSIVVSPAVLRVTTTTLAGGTVSTAYSQTLTATGGTTPYTWSITVGSLPAGLSLSTAGAITGTPTTAGTSSFTVQVKDANASTATQPLSIVVSSAVLQVTTTTLAGGTVNTAYSQSLTASGGTAPYTWSITVGSLPAGLSLSPAGAITGTPTTAGTSSFTVQVKDANASTATKALSIVVSSAVLQVTTTTLSGGTVNTAYSQTLTASGGTTPYTWSITVGALPAGLSLSPAGTITGTPTTAGTSNFTVQVKDANASTAPQPLSIVVSPAVLQVTTTTLAGGTVNTAYSQTLTATGGTTPYTWSTTVGALPAGLSLSTAGAITGTPTTAGTSSFTVQVKDANAGTATQPLSIVVANQVVAPPTCKQPTVQSGTNSLIVTATSNCTDSQSSITSTTIDWGDDSSPSSGTSATHTYASAGAFTITTTATDANNLSGSASVTVTVTDPLATPVTQGGTATQTVNVIAPPGVSSLTVTYTCVSANGPSETQTLAFYHLTGCTITGPNGSTVTLTSTPTPLTVTVQTTGTTALQSEVRTPKPRLGALYATFLFLPGLTLLGIGCSRTRRRKLGRYASIALLGLMMFSWLACGGGSSPQMQNQSTPTPAGTYGINGVGTSSDGTQVPITIGFSVTTG
jgi:hypothetical protein